MSNRIFPQVSTPQLQALARSLAEGKSDKAVLTELDKFAAQAEVRPGESYASTARHSEAKAAFLGASLRAVDGMDFSPQQRAEVTQRLINLAVQELNPQSYDWGRIGGQPISAEQLRQVPQSFIENRLGRSAELLSHYLRGGERPVLSRERAVAELSTGLRQLRGYDATQAQTLVDNFTVPLGRAAGGSEVWGVTYGDQTDPDKIGGGFFAVVVGADRNDTCKQHVLEGRIAANYFRPVEAETVAGHTSTVGELVGLPLEAQRPFEGTFFVADGQLQRVADYQNVRVQRFEHGAIYALQDKSGQWKDLISFGSMPMPAAGPAGAPFVEKADETRVNWSNLLRGINAELEPLTGKPPSYDDMVRYAQQLPEVGAPWGTNQATAALLPELTSAVRRGAIELLFSLVREGPLAANDARLPQAPWGGHLGGAVQGLISDFLPGGPLNGAFGLEAREENGTRTLALRLDAPAPFQEQCRLALGQFLEAVQAHSTPTGY